MSTKGQFNTKNPTIKRILKEATELSTSPSPDYHAEPLETNLFEWHFTLRGPPSSPYETGVYHGRIILPPQYPLRPPMFRFLTPTGRFEVNREICLSISGHHEETWQPAWGVRTALVGIRSFMVEGVRGQVGGIEMPDAVRKRLADESARWTCPTCAKCNADIMKEREELVKESGGEARPDELPEELRLAYRDELGKGKGKEADEDGRGAATAAPPVNATATTATTASSSSASRPVAIPAQAPALAPTRTVLRAPLVQQQRQSPDGSLAWIDAGIYGVVAALIFMVLKKIAA
ncbi:UBC-like protein [Corynespora cassiicola Philippines]|uniref:UBC-like protein n=1 Tax=Corynespora cassiicola Philippines TaxID=1448308 RepID=A0A2T2NKA2_CORCC|nr:UBC-like protein [Corynespora cassiicola Philippines]